LCDLAARLDHFIFDPETVDAKQLARDELSFETPDLVPIVDLEAYGNQYLQKRGAEIGSLGYIQEVCNPDLAQSITTEETFDPQMGGM